MKGVCPKCGGPLSIVTIHEVVRRLYIHPKSKMGGKIVVYEAGEDVTRQLGLDTIAHAEMTCISNLSHRWDIGPDEDPYALDWDKFHEENGEFDGWPNWVARRE